MGSKRTQSRRTNFIFFPFRSRTTRNSSSTGASLAMTDAFRAQLDALMGVDRNGRAAGGAKLDYTDPKVCRHYLEGLCPCELFVNTVRAAAQRAGRGGRGAAKREAHPFPPLVRSTPPHATRRARKCRWATVRAPTRRRCGCEVYLAFGLRRSARVSQLPSPPPRRGVQDAYLADKAAGKVNYEPELKARRGGCSPTVLPSSPPHIPIPSRLHPSPPQEYLTRLRTECDRRVARAASTLESKDPDLRSAPSVAALVDCPEAHALAPAAAAAEAALAVSGRGIADPQAEARARAAVDARAVAQATSAVAGFVKFTDGLAAAADAPRQAALAAQAAALLQQAEAAGEEGNVDEAQKLTAEAEGVKRLAAMPPPKLPGSDPILVRPPPLSIPYYSYRKSQRCGGCGSARVWRAGARGGGTGRVFSFSRSFPPLRRPLLCVWRAPQPFHRPATSLARRPQPRAAALDGGATSPPTHTFPFSFDPPFP